MSDIESHLTAICMLQVIIYSTTTRVDDYHFWEPLSSSLKQSLAIKPFLSGIQTQAMLHDLHMHLTVTEVDCPLCNHIPVQESIGLFCAEVSLPIQYPTPHFMAFIHKYTLSDPQYLVKEAKSGKDVHIIDCMDGTIEKNVLKLKFYVPLRFLAKGYKITFALSLVFNSVDINGSMTDISIPYMAYTFFKPTYPRYFSFDIGGFKFTHL